MSHEELTTILTEIEMSINSRPLTYFFNDQNEPLPLTPNNFLINGETMNLPEDEISLMKREDLINRIVYKEKILSNFWNRWTHEYIMELRNKSQKKYISITKLTIGDIVLIKDENQPRQNWKLGKFHELINSKDNLIPAVKLKVGKIFLNCPIQLIIPLKVG